MKKCLKCGVEFRTESESVVLCPACRRGWFYCSVCKEVRNLLGVERFQLWNGWEICRPCLERRMNKPSSKEELTSCNGCSKWGWRKEFTFDGEYQLCPKCVKEIRFCRYCRNIYKLEDNKFEGESKYCKVCVEKSLKPLVGVQPAGLKRVPIFVGEGPPWYGIELEVDEPKSAPGTFEWEACVRDLNKLGQDTGGIFFLKSDGSIHRGFELVSRPLSIRTWDSQTWLGEACQLVKDYGGASFNTETCGTHVHRSREDLTELNLTILVILFIRLQPFFEKIGQRRENGYCKYAFLVDDKGGKANRVNGKVIYKSVKDKSGSAHDRYQALNLVNQGTIECRIFRGTLCVESVLAYVHFLDRLVAFVKAAKVNLGTALRLPVVELWGRLEEFFNEDALLGAYLRAKKVGLRGELASKKAKSTP